MAARIRRATGALPLLRKTFSGLEFKIDPDLKPGVVSITHGWGRLPEETDYDRDGSNTGLLISTDRDRETINAMPRMSAVPVNIRPLIATTEVSASAVSA